MIIFNCSSRMQVHASTLNCLAVKEIKPSFLCYKIEARAFTMYPNCAEIIWGALKELKLSYHKKETLVLTLPISKITVT